MGTKQPLTDLQLKEMAPSIFATESWHDRSSKYKFIPTINIINALRDSGFYPVSANQSNTRIPGKKEYTKHVVRFREKFTTLELNELIPEFVLTNSHDGIAALVCMLGIYRCWCTNQCTVSDSTLSSIHIRHQGQDALLNNVIDVSARMIRESGTVLERVEQWRNIELSPVQQIDYANKALTYYNSAIEIKPDRILQARRCKDTGNDLWCIYNRVQENLIKGGILGRSSKSGLLQSTREIKSVDRDIKLNKQLWELASTYAGDITVSKNNENPYTIDNARRLIELYGSNWLDHINVIKPTVETNIDRCKELVKKYGTDWVHHTAELQLD